MNKKLSLLIMAVLFNCNSALAKVNVTLDTYVSVIAVNGEELGFTLFSNKGIKLPNGSNQLVVRVEKLVNSQSSQLEKFNSVPVIINFDAKDTDLELFAATNVQTVEQAKAFDKQPKFVLAQQGNKQEIIKTTQNILPSLGGFSRDYELEIARYNAKNNLQLSATSTAVLSVADKRAAPESDAINPVAMVKHWFEQASETEQKTFTELAFQSRKNNIKQLEDNSSKALGMMVHWYNESSAEQKKNVITWLFEKQ